jgi:hypothetical protein
MWYVANLFSRYCEYPLQTNPWYPLANVCELHSHCIVHLVELVVPAWWKWFMLKLQWNDSPCRSEVCIHVIMHGEYWHQVCLLLGHPAYDLCVIAFGHTHFVLDCRVCRLPRLSLHLIALQSRHSESVHAYLTELFTWGTASDTTSSVPPSLCRFTGNSAAGAGGAISINGGTQWSFSGCDFGNNTAANPNNGGGAVFLQLGAASFTTCRCVAACCIFQSVCSVVWRNSNWAVFVLPVARALTHRTFGTLCTQCFPQKSFNQPRE